MLLTCVFVPSTGRSGWAVLAAGALVASLLAVSAGPAGAAEVKAGDDNEASPGNEAPFSACVGDAVEAPDQGFSDVPAGHAFAEVISCIAYYGITNGTGDGSTYSPNADVSRAQMALFLYRAAALMGVDLMGGDDDMMADYSDIGDVWEEAQNAIRALARNGILMGRGMGLFEPAADITRAEMAAALVALLDHTPGAPVHTDDDGLYELGDSADAAEAPNDWFGDVRASKPRAVDNAVAAAYELGVTQGYSDGTFKPDDSVSRGEMAAFITRTLAHSNLRPAGLTAQNVKGTITVSVRGDRDADFAPVPNRAVDAFKAAASETLLFTSAGKCNSRVSFVDGANRCEIDGADPVTQTDGNTRLAVLENDVIGDGLTVWVWHGEIGDEFSEGDWAYELAVEAHETPAAPSKAEVSDSLPDGITKARFGTTVTVTVQLKKDSGDDSGLGTAGGEDGVEYTVVINKYGKTDGTDPDPNSDSAFATATETVKVADDGSAMFTLDAADANSNAMGNRVKVTYTITGAKGPTDLVPEEADPSEWFVDFTDEAAAVMTLKVEVAPYQEAPGAGETVGSAATVTATDQFGRPFRNAGIVLASDLNNNAGTPDAKRFTGSDGRVRIGYSYTGGADIETLTATYTPTAGDPVTGAGMAFWVTAWETTAGNGGSQESIDVLNVDVDADQVVVGTDTPMSVNYDSGDFFTVNDEPSSIAKFEEELAKVLEAKNKEGEGFNGSLTLSWQSYDHEDSADIASFALAATLSIG